MNLSTGAPLGLIALLALLCAVFTLLLPGSFATLGTLQSVLLQIPELGLLALAQMLPLVSGGINLAVVASANMAGLAMAWVLVGGLSALGLDLSGHEGLLIAPALTVGARSEEHTSELPSPCKFVCRLLLEKKNSTT